MMDPRQHDALMINLKMVSNELVLIQDKLTRAWGAAQSLDDEKFVEMMQEHIKVIQTELRHKLDKL